MILCNIMIKEAQMEELSVKEFAEQRGLGEMQMRRVLEHPDQYPWQNYGIDHAYKLGRRWRIRTKDVSMAVVAPGSAEAVDRLAWMVSSIEKSYPIRQALDDLQRLPIHQVVANTVKRLPPLGEIVERLAGIAKEAPPPHEVLLRLKPFFR